MYKECPTSHRNHLQVMLVQLIIQVRLVLIMIKMIDYTLFQFVLNFVTSWLQVLRNKGYSFIYKPILCTNFNRINIQFTFINSLSFSSHFSQIHKSQNSHKPYKLKTAYVACVTSINCCGNKLASRACGYVLRGNQDLQSHNFKKKR